MTQELNTETTYGICPKCSEDVFENSTKKQDSKSVYSCEYCDFETDDISLVLRTID